jgi:hypothetical protein
MLVPPEILYDDYITPSFYSFELDTASGRCGANSSARSRTSSLTVASARMRASSSSFEIGGDLVRVALGQAEVHELWAERTVWHALSLRRAWWFSVAST